MTNQQLAVREGEGLESVRDLEERFAIAVRQRELLESYIKGHLKPGKHFYTVAGSDKPSLNKDGAEIVCLPHGYKPKYDILSGPEEPADNDERYQITVRCTLMKGDTFEGQGIGSASSHVRKKDGTIVLRQPDIGLRHNATLKMAQKSAYIAATLNATAASEFFTQDMEDGAEVGENVSTPKDNRYWCAEHKTVWFKRGKMTGYAHPIGDTGKWCRMSDARLNAKDNQDQPSDTLPEAQEATPMTFTGNTLGDLWNYGLSLGFKNKAECLAALGIKDDALIADIQEAAEKLRQVAKAKEQAAKVK